MNKITVEILDRNKKLFVVEKKVILESININKARALIVALSEICEDISDAIKEEE